MVVICNLVSSVHMILYIYFLYTLCTFLLKKSLIFENTSLNGKWFLKVHLLSFPTLCVRKKSHGGFLRNSAKCKILMHFALFSMFFLLISKSRIFFEVFKWIFEASRLNRKSKRWIVEKSLKIHWKSGKIIGICLVITMVLYGHVYWIWVHKLFKLSKIWCSTILYINLTELPIHIQNEYQCSTTNRFLKHRIFMVLQQNYTECP